MKLYDVIRKEQMENGDPLPDLPDPERPVYYPARKRFSWRTIIVGGGAIVFLVLLYIIGMKVVRAKVVINERRIPFTLSGVEFELVHEEDATAGRLSFQTMIVPTEVSRQVYGSVVQPSTSSAKGAVVFFNEYSTKSQTIKKGTVVTSKEGKKYTTQAQVVVSGYTTKSGKKVPGTSPSVAITASGTGPSYNSSGTTFAVSGWGKTLYAQSSGSITGGNDGAAHGVAEADKPDVIATLQAQLIERLKRETRAQIPERLVTFPDLQVTTIDSSSLQLSGTSIKFPASIKGSMTTYLIDRDLLETSIANEVLSDHTYADVAIPTLADLTVEPVTALPTDPKSTPESIKVKISGQGTIIAKAPVLQIRESLIGTPKRSFRDILAKVPEVDTAAYHFYPFWAPFFPAKESRITVEVK